jgi:hypothetical protein
MSTLRLWFQGYTQFRMATDPDPSDDPRGLSGYTFALPGEPDFDQTLRFQPDEPGVWQRNFGGDTFAPRVGVTVRRAEVAGTPAAQYIGARVSLLEARLVELNGLVVRNDYFAVDPVHLRVSLNGSTLLERVDLLDPARPRLSILDAGTPELLRRQPSQWVSNSEEVAEATGLPQPVTDQALIENRQHRQHCLEALLAETIDPVERSGLETRIAELRILRKWWDLSEYAPGGPPLDRRAYTLALQAKGWNVGINGPVLVNQVGANGAAPWPLRFWLGGWDADALCAYIDGDIEIPLAAD